VPIASLILDLSLSIIANPTLQLSEHMFERQSIADIKMSIHPTEYCLIDYRLAATDLIVLLNFRDNKHCMCNNS